MTEQQLPTRSRYCGLHGKQMDRKCGPCCWFDGVRWAEKQAGIDPLTGKPITCDEVSDCMSAADRQLGHDDVDHEPRNAALRDEGAQAERERIMAGSTKYINGMYHDKTAESNMVAGAFLLLRAIQEGLLPDD